MYNDSDTQTQKTLYLDMDGVLVDFQSAVDTLSPAQLQAYQGRLDEVPGLFARMLPMPGALEAVALLRPHFQLYALSTASWHNPTAWSDKLLWIQRYFGAGPEGAFYKRLILSHQKQLNRGHFLVDDRDKNGAGAFAGELIRFGSAQFPDWPSVCAYLLART